MGLERNINREIHVLYPSVDFVAHCLLCNVIEVNPIDGGFDTIAEIHRVNETANLVSESRLEFVSDNVSNDIGKVGLIEGDRMETTILLLGEVFIHKGKLIPPPIIGKGNFQYILSPRKIKLTIFPQVGTLNEGRGLPWCGKVGVRH